jgi:glucose/arabinose dehydrogenase
VLTVLKVTTSIAFIVFFATALYKIEDDFCSTYAQEGHNFERIQMEREYLGLTTSQQVSWINYDPDTIFVSRAINDTSSGNGSLRVDVKAGYFVNETVDYPWSVISTDFIPVNENSTYKYSLVVSAKDVNQLHSKVYYYDSNKKEIPIENFIFGGRDGSFKETFSNSSLAPIEAKYVQLQMWVRPTLGIPSSFQIDDLKINSDQFYFSDPIVSYYIQTDPDLRSELVAQDLDYPTTMAFLGKNDILVLEKDKGTVERIVNGQTLEKPLIDTNVSGYGEDGLVGIAVMADPQINKTYVYLYYTESTNGDVNARNKPEGNRLYRYEFVNDQLINPKLILDLPHGTRGIHNGGKILVGPDNNVYITVGDVGRGHWDNDIDNQAQNNKTGQKPDGTGGILRVALEGASVGRGILGSYFPLNLYYAYGIRNSFGIDFDPVTGNLWDTENGDLNGDEINLVEPGFNSGWAIIEGMSEMQHEFNLSSLVDFNLKGKYSDPEFNWYAINKTTAVAPTALKFIDSSKYGKKYENDMLVGDFNYGRIYHFDLSKDRTKLSLTGDLEDKMTAGDDENFDILFAQAPGAVIDIQLGPDGYIYFVSLYVNVSDCDVKEVGCLVQGGIKGAIFRIVPNN